MDARTDGPRHRGISPLQFERAAKVESVVYSAARVPGPRRFFIALSIGFQQRAGERFRPDMLERMAGEVPRAIRLAVVNGERPCDDPDLPKGFGSDYFLEHAREMFLPSDADTFIHLDATGRSRAELVIAAAKLRPKESVTLLRNAFGDHNGEYDYDARRKLAAALIEISGGEGISRALDWFFSDKPEPGSYPGIRSLFLEQIHQSRPDLFAEVCRAIISDRRLEKLGPQTTLVLIEHVQSRLGRRVATEDELNDVMGIDESERDRKFSALGKWKQLLRDTLAEWSR